MGDTARALATRAATLPPPLLTALRRLDAELSHDGRGGVGVVVRWLAGAIPGLRFDDLDLEMRAVVSDAVRDLLRPALDG